MVPLGRRLARGPGKLPTAQQDEVAGLSTQLRPHLVSWETPTSGDAEGHPRKRRQYAVEPQQLPYLTRVPCAHPLVPSALRPLRPTGASGDADSLGWSERGCRALPAPAARGQGLHAVAVVRRGQ